MHHTQKALVTAPAPKTHKHTTAWSRYRTSGMPAIALFGAIAVAVGMLAGFAWLVTFGVIVAAVALAVLVPVLFLEYRVPAEGVSS